MTFNIQQANKWGTVAGIIGGNCSRLSIGRFKTEDVGTPAFPEIGYRLSGLRLQCRLLADFGNLVVNFGFADSEVYARLRVSPLETPIKELMLPMGEVKMTQCAVEARLSYLDFGGSESPVLDARLLREAIVAAVAQDANMLACQQIEMLVAQRATTALKHMAAQVMPLLASKEAQSVPTPRVRVMDFAQYPPLRLVAAMLRERAKEVADLSRRLTPLEMPVDYRLSSMSDGLMTAFGVNSVRVDGLDSFLSEALRLTGVGSQVDVALAFHKLRFFLGSEVLIETKGSTGKFFAEERYKSNFNMTLELGNISLSARVLAMLSQRLMDTLLVDQLQQPECLAAVARDAVAPAVVPVQLQQFAVNVTPSIHISCGTGVEGDFAETIETTVAALMRGYQPSLTALVPGLLERFRPKMDSAVGRFMDSLSPCRPTLVYLGPGEVVTTLLLCGAGLSAAFAFGALFGGLVVRARRAWRSAPPSPEMSPAPSFRQASLPSPAPLSMLGQALEREFTPQRMLPTLVQAMPLHYHREFSWEVCEAVRDKSLSQHPAVPEGLALTVSVCTTATACLFLYADLGLATVINLVIDTGGQAMTIGPAFAFSLTTCAWDAWKSGAYTIAMLIVLLSGVWPFMKLGLLAFSWYAPPETLSVQMRGQVLDTLDSYGKYSLIDSWLAILALNSYRMSWHSQDGRVVALVDAVPMAPFFVFVVATIFSLVLGHLASDMHRRAKERDGLQLELLRSDESLDASGQAAPLRTYVTSGVDRAAVWPRRFLVSVGLPLTIILVFVGAMADSFEVNVSGVVPALMLDSGMRLRRYGLYSLGASLTVGKDGDLGLLTVQAIFLTFALAIPLLLLGALILLWVIPLKIACQRRALGACKAMDAWASFDVFVLAVIAASLEFGRIANFLVYHDNISSMCTWVQSHFQGDCFHIECQLTSGFVALCLAGIASYTMPKVVFKIYDEALVSAGAPHGDLRSSEGVGCHTCDMTDSDHEDLSTAFRTPSRSPSHSSLASRVMYGFFNNFDSSSSKCGALPLHRQPSDDELEETEA